jgi:hypothetical protein
MIQIINGGEKDREEEKDGTREVYFKNGEQQSLRSSSQIRNRDPISDAERVYAILKQH